MTEQLIVEVVDADADDERLEDLTQHLRGDLLELDVDSVSRLSKGEAPPGTRAVELAAVATLVVVLKGSAELAEQVVSAVRSWLRRTPEAERATRSLKLTLNGQTLELSAATDVQQQQLVDQFLRTSLGESPTGPSSSS